MHDEMLLHVADLWQQSEALEDRLEEIRHLLVGMVKKPGKNEGKSQFPVFLTLRFGFSGV